MEPYGNLIKKRLIDIRMTQEDLANRVGCSRGYLNCIINGKKNGWKVRDRINEVLDLKQGA